PPCARAKLAGARRGGARRPRPAQGGDPHNRIDEVASVVSKAGTWQRGGYSIAAMRELARAALPRPVFDFADGGAEDETTLRRNETAFDEIELLPHPLTGAAARDL